MKVKIHYGMDNDCHFQSEPTGQLYYARKHKNGTVGIVRIMSPYSYTAAEYMGVDLKEAIHKFYNGREELVLSFLPLKEKPII